MRFDKHLELAGRHAFLSPSNYHWVNYDDDKLDRVYVAQMAAQRGTELHALAEEAIRLGIKFAGKGTVAQFVNDAIGYRMTPEQILYYSYNCFGTADAIGFRRNKLRIHDLKTGVTPSSFKQLEVYAALFCLEYRIKPFDLEMELRIYQNDAVQAHIPEPDTIFHIMDRIVNFDKRIEQIRSEAES